MSETHDIPGGVRILVVEDSKMMRTLIASIFEQLGIHEVVYTTNGHEGYEKIRDSIRSNTPFDLILTDLNMPIMTGFDMLRKVKNLKLSPLPPIVVLSSDNEISSVLEANELGAQDFLSKPFKAEEVREKLFRVLYPGAKNS